MADVVTRQGALRRAIKSTVQNSAIDWPRTLAVKAQKTLEFQHLQFQYRQAPGRLLHCLLLDCSASMVSTQMLAVAKGLLQHWTRQFYHQRADMAVVIFSGNKARILQAPRKASACSDHWISAVQGGGGSPIASGVRLVEQMLGAARKRQPDLRVGVWLMTDGRYSEFPSAPKPVDLLTVVDFDNASVRLDRALQLARHWRAEYVHVSGLIS